MSSRQPYDAIGAILSLFGYTHQWIVESLDDVPASRMTEQPGTLVNHPAWTLAHLNTYAGQLLALLDDPRAPNADAEYARYGYGTVPVPDPGAYLPKVELIAQFRERHERIAALVAERHAEYFPRPAPDKFHPHCPTIGHIAIIWMTTHLGDHFGQIRLWRRAAGFKNE
jgi:hypothetical protein